MSALLDGIRLVSWDCDGTLYSLPRLKRRLWRWALAPGRQLRVSDLFRMLEHHRALDRLRATPQRIHELAVFAGIAALEQETFAAIAADIGPSPKAVTLLNEARRRGLVQVVLSDQAAQAKVAALGLTDFFVAIYSAHALGALKPATLSFEHVQRTHGVAPHEHLHIGDRPATDGVGARAVGARFHRLRG